MNSFFTFFSANAAGIFIFLAVLASIILLFQWLFWALGAGRFKQEADRTAGNRGLRFIFADLLVAIINDFRHLLALVIVMIFAVSLGVAMYISHGEIDQFKEALQVVVATLGGLVGSIIGYYFGESAVAKHQAPPLGSDGTSAGGGKVVEPASGKITKPPRPPELQEKLKSQEEPPQPPPPSPEAEG